MTSRYRKPIYVEATGCLSALGDEEETCRQLIDGVVALEMSPVLGKDGGDKVPLASVNGYDETLPPRWQEPVSELFERVPQGPWGTARYPVFLTSSNYDVGSLYAYRNTGNTDFLACGTPAHTLERLKTMFGWGENSLALSHACVTANLGIELATQQIASGLADRALIFSFDFISPFVAGGFHALKILNDQFPAPFADRGVGSIGLGDGAGFVVLGQEPSSVEVMSNFLYNELYHFTANDPSGSGFAAAADWLAGYEDIGPVWVKGHGTGTLEAGKLEAESFNKRLPHSPLVSWKGSLGHTLGSCGIVEMAVALAGIQGGIAPGTVGTQSPTFADNVALDAFDTSLFRSVALFSNAFGGAHAGCLLRYA